MVVMTEMPHDHKPSPGLQQLRDPSWPSLGGAGGDAGLLPASTAAAGGGADWGEFEDTGSDDDEKDEGAPKSPRRKGNPKILHRCASTPDFGYNDGYSPEQSDSSVGPEADEGERKAGTTPAEAVVVTPSISKPFGSVWGPGASKGGVRRSPSFAEMVKVSAEASAEEEAKKAAHLEATAERLKKEREARRKARARHMKLVVTPIKRCTKSTGDLQSLSRIHETSEHDDAMGGGGGGGFGDIAEHHEDEVLGDTDAMDFYHRKAKGVQNRASGKMIRPDEAKRKEISVHKKDVQREKQQAAQGKGGGGKKKGGGEKTPNKGKKERRRL